MNINHTSSSQVACDADDLRAAVETMRRGGIIAYPTDTVWGIGCDATQGAAVKRIYELKRRSDSKAMITLVCDETMLEEHLANGMPVECRDFLSCHSDRPVTMVYPHGTNVAPELLAADGSIGMRVVGNGFAHDLCRMLGVPVVSTSANVSGNPAARTFAEIAPEILAGVDYVCTTGRENAFPGKPSMVGRLTENGEIEILRG